MSKRKPEEKISEALGAIGDDLIRDAEENVPVVVKKKNAWIKWVAIAASVMLLAVSVPVVLLVSSGFGSKNMAERSESGDAPASDEGIIAIKPGTAFTNKSDAVGGDVPHLAEPGVSEGRAGEVKEEPGMVPDEFTYGDDKTKPADTEEPSEPEPGQLTASAWNDNDHYAKYRDLFTVSEQGTGAGKFADFVNGGWNLSSTYRISASVTSGGTGVAGARVSAVSESGETLFAAVTDARGIAYLFPERFTGYVEVSGLGIEPQRANASGSETEFSFELSSSAEKKNTIELMYVIDATGSMQDELSYIKREIRDVVEKVAAANPESEIRLSFLFYRDDFDEEKFMFLDFVTTDDDAKFAEQLRAIAPVDACGGDDYPEAVDEALLLAADANWSTEATTKIVFHVLDAPAHETPEVKARYSEAVRKAAEKGIRLCPVLSSGADTLTEYLCRSEAVLTGGTFVYLTDDSGIGGGHLDPDLPDAVVEYLNALMIRLINGYHTGSFADPVPWNAAE